MLNHSFNIEITRIMTTTKKQKLVYESMNEPDDFMGYSRKGKNEHGQP